MFKEYQTSFKSKVENSLHLLQLVLYTWREKKQDIYYTCYMRNEGNNEIQLNLERQATWDKIIQFRSILIRCGFPLYFIGKDIFPKPLFSFRSKCIKFSYLYQGKCLSAPKYRVWLIDLDNLFLPLFHESLVLALVCLHVYEPKD